MLLEFGNASSTLIGIGSLVGVAVVGALATTFFQRRSDRRRQVEASRFQVYMKLLEVSSSYYWITVAEFHGESPRPEVQARLIELSWCIADKLRETNEIEHFDEILRVLLAEDFATAADRAKAIDALIERLGRIVDPRYGAAIKAVSARNTRRMLEEPSFRRNAPGAT